VDGFIADREGAFGWAAPSEEQFRFHIAQVRELGLVDELRIVRNPVVVGGGTPFLPPVTEDIALDLVETRTFGSRVIYERYGRAR
jgi:dihydrofolate reductase